MSLQPQARWQDLAAGKNEATGITWLRFTGKQFTGNFADALASGTLSLSMSQVTQLSLTMIDTDDLYLSRSYVLAAGVTVSYADWWMEIRGREVNADELTVQITARSKRIGRLKDWTGKRAWGNQRLTSWVRDEARRAGFGKFIVEPSTVKGNVVRAGKTKDQEAESSWDVMGRIKDQLGYELFEYGDTLVFASRKYLRGKGGNRWHFWWNSRADMVGSLAASPAWGTSKDSAPAETLTLSVLASNAADMRPGDTVHLTGKFPPWNGWWMVTEVGIPMVPNEPVSVTCERA